MSNKTPNKLVPVMLIDYIDASGSRLLAIERCERIIKRRLTEGKGGSPGTEERLAQLLALPIEYRTPKQLESADIKREATGGDFL
tara:strand:- start:22949 stop:23203 length:255 start_codon:yes stop_codon:yes gene_type:complete